MTLSQRLRLYLAGFLAGCVLVYFLLFYGKERASWLPDNRVKEQVNKSLFIFSDHAKCILQCKNISEEEVTEVLKTGEVNFSASDTRGVPCPSCALEGKTSGNKSLRVIVTVFEKDSTAEITTAINLEAEKDTCNCR